MNSVAARSTDNVQHIANCLRRAYVRTSGVAASDRKRVLSAVLAYQLRGLSRDKAAELLRRVADVFGAAGTAPAGPMQAPESASNMAWRTAMRDLVQLIDGQGVTQDADEFTLLQAAFHRLSERAAALAHVLHKSGLPLNALLERAARDLATHDQALEQAARESFDRVLSAVNPDELKKNVAKKALWTETAYKAALFDAAMEKFKQLEMYHGKGRLVRDYKTAYKKYVRDQSTN